MNDIRKKTVYTLVEPVTIEGRTITELTFRRIKGKDLRRTAEIDSDFDKMAFLLAELSGNPPELVDEMDAADIEGAGKILEGFMGRKARR